MKLFVYLPTLLLSLAACQSNSSNSANAEVAAPNSAETESVELNTATPALSASDSVKARSANPEHIEEAMLTINGKAHDPRTTQLLERQLGRPDSIAKEVVECGGMLDTEVNAKADFWYYGKTIYEVYGSKAALSSFDVTTGKFRGKLGQLVLDKNTTLEDVRRYYPVSSKEADEPATGRPGEVMSLPIFYKGESTDYSLTLTFKKGHLQEVAFWTPC